MKTEGLSILTDCEEGTETVRPDVTTSRRLERNFFKDLKDNDLPSTDLVKAQERGLKIEKVLLLIDSKENYFSSTHCDIISLYHFPVSTTVIILTDWIIVVQLTTVFVLVVSLKRTQRRMMLLYGTLNLTDITVFKDYSRLVD